MNISLPDEILQTAQISESELLREIAILLYQQHRIPLDQAAELSHIAVDDFYQILIDRHIVASPTDPDNDLDELILASLRRSLQQAKEGKVHPISELWEGIVD
jgi:predicted HTH domain antitoxin